MCIFFQLHTNKLWIGCSCLRVEISWHVAYPAVCIHLEREECCFSVTGLQVFTSKWLTLTCVLVLKMLKSWHVQTFGVVQIFLKEDSFAQGCNYLIKNTVKSFILCNIITVPKNCFQSEYIVTCHLLLWSKLKFQHHYSSLQFNSIQDYLYSAFHDTIVATQLYRKLSFYNRFIYFWNLIYLSILHGHMILQKSLSYADLLLKNISYYYQC